MQFMKKDGEVHLFLCNKKDQKKNGGKYTNQINPITAMHKIVTTTFFYLFATIFWLALQGCIEKFSI